jgi:hypothetical protein
MIHKDAVLCYVAGQWAYFTTRKLSEPLGDDWNDAPYEHNAGTPYEFGDHDRKKGIHPWFIIKVAWDGNFNQPHDHYHNSPWSVEQINAGAVAWLVTSKSSDNKWVTIPAGTTLDRFCELIRIGGGTVFLANANGAVEANLEAIDLRRELEETNNKWRADGRLLSGALLLLNENGIGPGSTELLEAAKRAELRDAREGIETKNSTSEPLT